MSFKMDTRQVGKVAVVDMSGRITLGEASGSLRGMIKELIGEGQKNILLNLGEVSHIDSAGLGELVGGYATVRNQGGQLKLLNLQKKVDELLQVTKLYTVFEAFTDEAAAIRSFQAKAAAQ